MVAATLVATGTAGSEMTSVALDLDDDGSKDLMPQCKDVGRRGNGSFCIGSFSSFRRMNEVSFFEGLATGILLVREF